MPAYDNAINVTDWATRLSYSADTQEIGWAKSIVLGTRGRLNPFYGLIGGLNGMKPVTEIMDFRALQGQEIVMTLDRPLGGPGTQGPASLNRVVGRGENVKHSTYRCKVGVLAHMVDGEQIVKTQTKIGEGWDNRQRRKLTEWFAWKQGDDFQFEMMVKAHVRNTVYPNNKTSIDDLLTTDYLDLPTVTAVQETLNANQGEPFDVSKGKSGEEILTYLLMAPAKAWRGVQSSNQYQQLLSNADVRGDLNKIFKGGLPDYFGTRLYKWNVEDGTQIGPLGAPCSPIQYLGADIPATTTTTPSDITAGSTADNAVPVLPLFFQYYSNAQYIGHEGEKVAADVTTVRYLAIKIISGSDTGKVAIFSYKVNTGNKITMYQRLGAANSGSIQTTIGSMTYDAGAWTAAAGSNGFKGVSTGIVPAGSIIYEVNARGVAFVRGYGLARNAIVAGWGSLAPLGAEGQGGSGGGGTPGQRLFEAQDGGRLFSVGWQQVWGATATRDANGLVNSYVLVVSAYQPAGMPDITS